MAKMGRPLKEIDQQQFENLCGLQCTQEEICAWFDVTVDTIWSWCKRTYGKTFSEVFRQKRGKGKISLRRKQFKLADTSAAMAIFLGKNMLGQSDKLPEEENAGMEAIVNLTKSNLELAKNVQRETG